MKIFIYLVLTLLVFNIDSENNPKNVLLNEIYTQGYQFIELSTTCTDPEVTLDKYALTIYSQEKSGIVRIRAIIDLRRHKFPYNERLGLVGDVVQQYHPKLLDQELDTLIDVRYNKDKHAFNYLTVGKYQYLHVVLTYSDNYIFDVFTWNDHQLNLMTDGFIQYLQTNLVDLVIIKGPIVGQKCSAIEGVWKKYIGCNKLTFLTDPATKEIRRDHFSISSCSILFEPFKYDTWAHGKPTPGAPNDCSGYHDPIPTPRCEKQQDCSDIPSTSYDTDSTCAHEYTLQIQQYYHQREPGHLWQYDSVLNHLSNKMGYWMYQDTKSFIIPNVNEEGYIEDKVTGWVLGIEGDGKSFGTNVILQPKHHLNEQKQLQIWIRSEKANGDFTLRNLKTGKDLFSASDSKITITDPVLHETAKCPTNPEMSSNKAKIDVWWDIVLERKRKFVEDMTYNDQEWNFSEEFDDNWISDIETYQSDKIPIKEFLNAREWIELKKKYPPQESRIGCKRCRRNAKKFKVKPQLLSDFAKDGVLFSTLEENRKAIIEHEKSLAHRKIEDRLKEDQLKAGLYSDITFVEDSEVLVTAQVMRTVYTAVKHMGASYNSIEHMVDLQEEHKVDMGTACKSRRTFTDMSAVISNGMHKRLTSFLRNSKNPLSIIVDGSTDVSNNHLLAVMIQTVENEVPVTFLYGMLKIGSDETAEAQTALLIDRLKEDMVFDAVKSNIISFVSDGAAVMTGKHKGMATRLKKIFGSKLISVHCAAHRIELGFGHAMEEYESFKLIEVEANNLYSYFSKSHKRFAQMNDFLDENQLEHFRLHYINKIRWVSQHRRAVKQIFDHVPEIAGYLDEFIESRRRITNPYEGVLRSIKKAEKIRDFVTDKNAILLMVFNIDVQGVFGKQSLVYQADDDSIISFSRSKQEMMASLDELQYVADDSELKKFLLATICDDGAPCQTIQGYEQSQVVTYTTASGQSVQLVNKANSPYDKLSEIKTGYLNELKEQLNEYIPEIQLMDFDILDQRLWQDELTQDHVKDKMLSVVTELKLSRPRVLGKELFKLISTIKASPKWCQIRDSKPNWFWSSVLRDNNIQISEGLRNVIRSAMAIPMGSASAERTFSVMNFIKTAQRSNLTPANIEHFLRIRLNGPHFKGIQLKNYAPEWIATHGRCDPLFPHVPKKAKKSDCDEGKKEQQLTFSNIFS